VLCASQLLIDLQVNSHLVVKNKTSESCFIGLCRLIISGIYIFSCQSGSRLWMWHLARCANLVEHLLVRWRFDPWHRSLLRSFEDVDSVMWFLSSINCCPWKSQVFNYRVCKLMRITICLKCPALLRCIGTKNGGTPHLRVLQGAIDVKDMLSVMALVAVPCLTSQEQ